MNIYFRIGSNFRTVIKYFSINLYIIETVYRLGLYLVLYVRSIFSLVFCI